MRLTILLLLTVFSGTALAQANLTIAPVNEANCQLRDYSHVNSVYEVQKIDESPESVTYEFLTRSGVCKGGEFLISQVYGKKIMVELYDQTAIFPKRGIDLNQGIYGFYDHKVTVVFDKTKLFKVNKENPEKSVLKKVLNLDITPGGFWGNTMFRWEATLEVGETLEQTEIAVRLIGASQG